MINAQEGIVTMTVDDGTSHLCQKSESESLEFVINTVQALSYLVLVVWDIGVMSYKRTK